MTDDKKKRIVKPKKPNLGGRPAGVLTEDSRTDRIVKLKVGECAAWAETSTEEDILDRRAGARAKLQAFKSLMHKTVSRAKAITLGSYQIGGEVITPDDRNDQTLYSVVIVKRTK